MMEKLSVKELGQLADLFMRAGHLTDAQSCLTEMQTRLDALAKAVTELPMQEPRKIFQHRSERFPGIAKTAEGPQPRQTKTLPERLAEHEANIEEQSHVGEMPDLSASQVEAVVEAAQEGIVYDDDHNVIAISAQEGNRGYDPEAHKKQIRIYLDGKHIENAHTADVEAGTIKEYYRNERSRIRTRELTGKVEIRVHVPDGQVEIPL
jgi:hypothetical protein